jgi:hypothetical protein
MISIPKETIAKRLGLESFDQTVLHKALQRTPEITPFFGPWIAGGAVRRTLQDEKLDSDFDFFFRNESQYDYFKAELIAKGFSITASNDKNTSFKAPGYFDEPDGEGKGIWVPEMRVQAINFRYYDTPEEIIDSFDFTLSQFVYDGMNVHMGEFSLWDVARKKLVPHKITYGVSSLRRILKYTRQGYTICAGGLGEVLEQVVANPEIIQKETLYID